MNSLNSKLKKEIELLNILSSVDLSKIKKKEINFFKIKKKLLAFQEL